MSQGTGFRPKQTEALLSIYQGLLGPESFRDKAVLVTEELASLARAENGEQAWQSVQSRSYDCVIADLKLPGMSGKELYEAIENFDENLARRVVF